MDRREVSDGAYTATVAAHTGDFTAFIAPECDPSLLMIPADDLPHTEIESGDSITITINDDTLTALQNTPK